LSKSGIAALKFRKCLSGQACEKCPLLQFLSGWITVLSGLSGVTGRKCNSVATESANAELPARDHPPRKDPKIYSGLVCTRNEQTPVDCWHGKHNNNNGHIWTITAGASQEVKGAGMKDAGGWHSINDRPDRNRQASDKRTRRKSYQDAPQAISRSGQCEPYSMAQSHSHPRGRTAGLPA